MGKTKSENITGNTKIDITEYIKTLFGVIPKCSKNVVAQSLSRAITGNERVKNVANSRTSF